MRLKLQNRRKILWQRRENRKNRQSGGFLFFKRRDGSAEEVGEVSD